MVRKYPQLGVELVGEPGDVRTAADSLRQYEGMMNAVPDKGMQVDQCFSDGNTRYRALAAVLEMNNRITASVRSMGNNADQLHGWADHIDTTRDKLADLEREMTEKKAELATMEANLWKVPEGGLREDAQVQISDLNFAIGDLKATAQHIVGEYKEEATKVGETIAQASLDSPGADPGARAARDNLKLANVIATVTGPLGLAGGLVGLAGKKLGSEALKRVTKALAGVGIGSNAAQLSAKGAADLAGANVPIADYVVTAAGLSKGITSEVVGNKHVDGALDAAGKAGKVAGQDESPTVDRRPPPREYRR